MSYRIRPEETLEHGIRRALREQVDAAIAAADVPSDAPQDSIHEIRKRLKKVRGALRLVRLHIPGDVFDRENVHHRDTGRLLSKAREAQVAPETLERIVDETDELTGDEDALDHTRERLDDRRGALHERAVARGSMLTRVRERLLEARERLPVLPLKGVDPGVLARGVRKVYKRGARRRLEAYDDGGPAVFHEWRKRAKYLWYHLRLLAPAWPQILEPWAGEQHELTDRLGLANDLADLERDVADDPQLLPEGSPRRIVLDTASRLRTRSWEDARLLGRRLYAEAPPALESRVRHYLAWRRGPA
jgi:CHAD domain-containing protein